jgi:hypothetical protein
MSKVKLKLASHDDEDYGYVAIGEKSDKEFFLSHASKDDATVFIQEKYKKSDDIFYYKVDGTKNKYLDEHTRSGVVFPETPFISAESSSIHAWQLNDDNELIAIYGGVGAEALGDSHNSKQEKIKKAHSNAIFCNLEGYAFQVTIEHQ